MSNEVFSKNCFYYLQNLIKKVEVLMMNKLKKLNKCFKSENFN